MFVHVISLCSSRWITSQRLSAASPPAKAFLIISCVPSSLCDASRPLRAPAASALFAARWSSKAPPLTNDASRRPDDAISRRCHAVGVVSRRSNRSAFQSTLKHRRSAWAAVRSPKPNLLLLLRRRWSPPSLKRRRAAGPVYRGSKRSTIPPPPSNTAAVLVPPSGARICPLRRRRLETRRPARRGALVVRRGCLANDDEEDEVVESIKKRHCEEPPLSPKQCGLISFFFL
jgi:hypothetical protein